MTWLCQCFTERRAVDKAQQRRWMVLGCAFCATVAAMIYPTEQEKFGSQFVQSHHVKSSRNVANSTESATPSNSNSNLLISEDIAFHGDDSNYLEGGVDPFAPRSWQAAPQPIIQPQVQVAAAVLEPVISAAPIVPPLPFRFMGRLSGDGEPVVYVSWGDKTYVAKKGEVFDSTYKVLDVTANGIEFEYLATKDHQIMPITASDN